MKLDSAVLLYSLGVVGDALDIEDSVQFPEVPLNTSAIVPVVVNSASICVSVPPDEEPAVDRPKE